MTGEVMPVGSRTPQEWADYINAAWQQTVESFVEVGRRMNEAKNNQEHGKWLDTLALTYARTERTAQRFMAIERHPDISNTTHVSHLPLSWGTLAELARLPEGELPKAIEAGVVTPTMERKEATALVREVKARDDQHAERSTPDPVSTATVYRRDGTTLQVAGTKGKPKFNRTNEQVSWADWTWNPVHGCLHACAYCYAWELAELPSYAASYPEGFVPMFRPDRLDAPAATPLPAEGGPSSRRVFVSSMGDLFGEWVPQQWITEVMHACVTSPDWTYLFLTKFPQRYARLELPPSVWLGTSVDVQRRVKVAEKAMAKIPDAAVRWLSCEPLLEPVVFSDLSWCDWLVIGSQSAAHGQAEVAPPLEWVVSLIGQAKAADVPVYCKPNLLGVVNPQSPGMALPQEMPRGQ